MTKIKIDKRNYRKHSDKNLSLIEKSLKECGAGRSILLDSEDEIIAGNGVYEQAKKLNIPVKIIETDGSELVVVKRTENIQSGNFCKGIYKSRAITGNHIKIAAARFDERK